MLGALTRLLQSPRPSTAGGWEGGIGGRHGAKDSSPRTQGPDCPPPQSRLLTLQPQGGYGATQGNFKKHMKCFEECLAQNECYKHVTVDDVFMKQSNSRSCRVWAST